MAEIAIGCREPVVHTIQAGKTKAPVEMVGLNGIRGALDVNRQLIELNRIRHFGISRGRVSVGSGG